MNVVYRRLLKTKSTTQSRQEIPLFFNPAQRCFRRVSRSMTTWLLTCLLAVVPTAYAAEGGMSNYVPGFYGDLTLAVAPPDGWSVRNDAYYYSGEGSGSIRSGLLELGVDISTVYNFTSMLYKPGIEFLGGQLAFGATVPVGYVDFESLIRFGDRSMNINDTGKGFSDLTGSVSLYWSRDKFHFNWGNFLVMPTGKYDVNDIANLGMNYYTFETDFMMTYLDEAKGRDFSIVAGYNYNFENDDTNYQTGDEFHMDIVLNQFLSESFAVGLSGFYLKQLGGDSGAGAALGDFKGKAWGLGPNVYFIKKLGGRDVAFVLKWLKEIDSENRLDGDHVFASFALSF